MDLSWITHYLLATISLLAVFAASYVDGLRCHVCEKNINNEKCNSQVAECTNQSHDACYTKIEKYESGKHYTKGCINYNDCKKLEDLYDAKHCSRSPSSCHYCCKKTKCNGYNSGNTTSSLPLLLSIGVYVSLALCYSFS